MLKSLYIDIRNRLRELIAGTEFDGKVFFVGGCCRDDIMGTEIKDIDISVALPDGGIRLAMWLHENGHLAGEVSAYPEVHTAKFRLADFPDVELESVHTRKESYPDRGSRNPVTDYGTHEEDCFRRDFTVNALYQNISTGEIIDITGKVHNLYLSSFIIITALRRNCFNCCSALTAAFWNVAFCFIISSRF